MHANALKLYVQIALKEFDFSSTMSSAFAAYFQVSGNVPSHPPCMFSMHLGNMVTQNNILAMKYAFWNLWPTFTPFLVGCIACLNEEIKGGP